MVSYAAAAATSLALLLRVGRRVCAALERSIGKGPWWRRGMGATVLASLTAVALGLDAGVWAMLWQGGGAVGQKLPDQLNPAVAAEGHWAAAAGNAPAGMIRVQAPAQSPLSLPAEGMMPPLAGAVEWLNSPPLTAAELRGKVVLVDFWTFGCGNCRHALPHVREWHRKYKDRGLVVIGVHTPEFAYERNLGNLKQALRELDVPFPVAVDNDFTIWRAFRNNYWPAHYFVDAKGQIRFHHVGEGEYEKSEQVIQQLLGEARKDMRPS